ncbi:MAG: nuclear transport factor 2 family protein [Gammaproteobacteria bacterium]|nr:nuclear transport factor 2 family protein [Gammaproteobacteria bacterium]MBT8445395.1 nuclear transport factor 2 family protein [Gammaproteobacteria bacterium]NND36757.1 nuclear transport factor 2 family protein [Gammaproteobacteria bacterium]
MDWIKDMFAALDAEGVPGLFPYLHDDVLFRFGSFPPGHGRETFDETWRAISTDIASLSHELLDVWDMGESAVCRGNVTYELKDGRSVTVPFVNVFYLRDGKIAEYLIYVDASAVFGPSEA